MTSLEDAILRQSLVEDCPKITEASQGVLANTSSNTIATIT